MKLTSNPQASPPGNDARIEKIQAGIDDTRGEVAATVAQLSQKFDLKSRTQHKLQDIKHSAPSRKAVAVGAAITVTAIAGAVVGLRRRQR